MIDILQRWLKLQVQFVIYAKTEAKPVEISIKAYLRRGQKFN